VRDDPVKVGALEDMVSDQYGSITYAWVAKFSFLGADHANPPCPDLFSKIHPKNIFGSYGTMQDASCFKQIGDQPHDYAFFLALPLDAFNEGWWERNPDCLYRRQVKRRPRSGLPPVGVSTREYGRWIRDAHPLLEQHLNLDEIESLVSSRR
jgi:hypothetical protein